MGTAAMSSSPSIVAANDRAAERTARRLPAAVRAIVIARLAPEARASHADLIRDLSPYLSQKLAAGAIRDMLSEIVAELVDAGLAVEDCGRITLLDRGNAEARKLLAPAPLPKDWIGVRDCRLVPLALGITGQPAAKL